MGQDETPEGTPVRRSRLQNPLGNHGMIKVGKDLGARGLRLELFPAFWESPKLLGRRFLSDHGKDPKTHSLQEFKPHPPKFHLNSKGSRTPAPRNQETRSQNRTPKLEGKKKGSFPALGSAKNPWKTFGARRERGKGSEPPPDPGRCRLLAPPESRAKVPVPPVCLNKHIPGGTNPKEYPAGTRSSGVRFAPGWAIWGFSWDFCCLRDTPAEGCGSFAALPGAFPCSRIFLEVGIAPLRGVLRARRCLRSGMESGLTRSTLAFPRK